MPKLINDNIIPLPTPKTPRKTAQTAGRLCALAEDDIESTANCSDYPATLDGSFNPSQPRDQNGDDCGARKEKVDD